MRKSQEDIIQADNKYRDGERNMMEINDREQKKSIFEKVLEQLGINYIRTRPYSLWQNGVVERSHKLDNDLFYSRRRFKSEMYKSFIRYSVRTNNIVIKVLDFKIPNEMVELYFTQVV